MQIESSLATGILDRDNLMFAGHTRTDTALTWPAGVAAQYDSFRRAGKSGRREPTVHVASPISRSLDEIFLAESLLGRDHALVRALDRHTTALAQLFAVIALLTVSVVGVAAGGRGALPVVVASALATIGFGCRAALRALDRRECAWDLIISGRDDVTLVVVERER
jgi:hypothetical protein